MPPYTILTVLAITTLALHAQLTPLTRAIRLEDFEEAKKLITPELVNKMDQGQYHPLTYAAYTGDAGLVEALLESGADPNVVEHNGKTALYVAANVGSAEIITLLHQHGATLPRAEHALPVGRAAVYSSCPETLATLLKHFPTAPLDQGWEQPGDYRQDIPGGAFNYALRHGYFETALVLARQARQLPVTDWRGRNALQMAASHAGCPVEVADALMDRGMSPIAQFPGDGHLAPATALELAAARGSLEVVQAMIRRCDAKRDQSAINQAAYIGAASNRSDVVRFLLGFLGAKLPSAEGWLERYAALKGGTAAVRKRDEHNPIRTLELRQLLPNPRPGKLDPGLSGTIAVVSSDRLRDPASLLTVALSAADGITVVERDALSAALREKSLAEFQDVDSSALHRTFGLIPAEHVVLLSEERIDGRVFLQLALLHTRSGVVMTRLALPGDSGSEELEEAAHLLLVSLQRSVAGGGQVAAVSITPVKPEVPTEQSLSIARQVNTLLPFHAGRTIGCVVLERNQLLHLESEKALGVEGAYWSGGWVIDGGIGPAGPGRLTLTLRATSTTGGHPEEVERAVRTTDLKQGILEAWQHLATKISGRTKVSPANGDAGERAVLAKHARWLFSAGYLEDAVPLADACLMLGDDDQETLRLALEIRLAALPISIDEVCKHIEREPRYLEPWNKFPLIRHFDTYLGLAETAVRYIPLNEHRLIATRPDGPYNEFVSQTLNELMFFRTLMDDAVIAPGFDRDIRSLDLKINQLTGLYFEIAGGDESEFGTLMRFLGGDSGYCARFNPGLIQQIAKRTRDLRERRVIPSTGRLYEILHRRMDKAMTTNLPIDPWIDAWDGKLSELSRFSMCKVRTRAERMRRIDEAMKEWPPVSRGEFMAPWVELTGSERPAASIWSSYRTRQAPGGIEGYLLRSTDALVGTAEGRRMYGLYWSAHQLASQGVDDSTLQKYLNPGSHNPDDLWISPAGWRLLEPIIANSKQFDKKARATLDQLMQEQDAPEPVPDKAVPQAAPDANAPEFALRLGSPEILFPPSSGSQLPAQVLHPAKAAFTGDQLWMPATYTEPGTTDLAAREKIPVIHVLDLSSKRFRTIKLPPGTPCDTGGEVPERLKAPTSDRRILMGETMAYYLALGRDSPSKLFCIERRTLAVREVKLPLPYILAVPFRVIGDRLYLSVASMERGNMLVTIDGDRVGEPMVSNLRRPAHSPLDDPETWITSLHSEPGRLVAFSQPDQADRAPDRVKTGVLDTKTGKWELVSLDAMKALDKARQETLDQHHYDRCAINLDGRLFHPFQKGAAALTFTPNRKALTQRFGTMMNPFKESLRSLPVEAEELPQSIFDLQVFRFESNSSSKGDSSRSANDLIRGKEFGVYLVGRWQDQLLVSLHHRGAGVPAIWIVPTKDIELQLAGAIAGQPLSGTKTKPVEVTPAIPPTGSDATYLKSGNSDAGDEFGTAVAMDGRTAVIGAPGEDSQPHGLSKQKINDLARDSGAVYVFGLDDSNSWTEQALLKADNTDPKDNFGEAVAISGNMIVVGARRESSAATGTDSGRSGPRDNSARQAGAAYVFVRDDAGTWTQDAYLKASNTEAGDDFGRAVAISGNRVVVGAPTEDSGATGVDGDQGDNSDMSAGAAYVFARSPSGEWRQEAYLKASNTPHAGHFGRAVAISGDTVVVTAPEEHSKAKGVNGNQNALVAADSGAAYVFQREDSGTWSQQAYLKASDTAPNTVFGMSLALSDHTLVVGAPCERPDKLPGAAYVFVREDSGRWQHQARLRGGNTRREDRFGWSVAVSENTVVVGANEVGSGSKVGATYIFQRNKAGKWTQTSHLKAPHPDARDEFGQSVAISGSAVMVGTPGDDGSGTGMDGDPSNNSEKSSGAVYLFDTGSGTP